MVLFVSASALTKLCIKRWPYISDRQTSQFDLILLQTYLQVLTLSTQVSSADDRSIFSYFVFKIQILIAIFGFTL